MVWRDRQWRGPVIGERYWRGTPVKGPGGTSVAGVLNVFLVDRRIEDLLESIEIHIQRVGSSLPE